MTNILFSGRFPPHFFPTNTSDTQSLTEFRLLMISTTKKPICFSYTLSHRSVRFMSTNKTRNKWLPISFVGFLFFIVPICCNHTTRYKTNSKSLQELSSTRWRSVWRTPSSLQILPTNSVHLTPRLIRTYLHFQTRTFWLISIVNWAIRRRMFMGFLCITSSNLTDDKCTAVFYRRCQ